MPDGQRGRVELADVAGVEVVPDDDVQEREDLDQQSKARSHRLAGTPAARLETTPMTRNTTRAMSRTGWTRSFCHGRSRTSARTARTPGP